MSDTSQGPGWWIASDGKWYSPEQKPGPAPEPPVAEPAPTQAPTPEPVAPEPVEAPAAAAPVTPPAPAPQTPPLAAEPPTEPIPVTPPPASTPPPTYVPPPMGAPPGGPPPMVTPPAGGYAAPPVAGAVADAPVKKGNGCLKAVLIVGAIIAVLGIAAVAILVFAVNRGVDTVNDKLDAQQQVENRTGIKSNSFNTEHPPQDDLASDWKCTSTPNGFPQVTGSVKNNSSNTSSYAITVDFKENGTEFDSASGLIVSVDPGQTADFAATGSVKPTGTFTCRIDTIDRTDIAFDTGN